MSQSRTSQASAIAENCPRVSAEANSPTRAFRRQTVYALRQAPPWLPNTIAKLERLSTLEENWDSYGAVPIDLKSIAGAQRLVSHLASFVGVDEPAVGATPDGEAGLSWDGGHWSLDADINLDGRIDFVYINDRDATADVEASTRDPNELVLLLTDWK